jgi:nitric oxide synthase oxygenase domain/subunit
MFALFEKYVPDFSPELRQAWQTLFDRVTNVMKLPKMNEERLLKRAKQYLDQIALEQEWEAEDKARRWAEIQEEVKATGTYTHTYEELAYGAQLSWRNASKCIARIQWNNMVVRDRRHVTDPDVVNCDRDSQVNNLSTVTSTSGNASIAILPCLISCLDE